MKLSAIAFLSVAGILLGLCSCELDTTPSGPMQQSSVNIDKGSIERANVRLDMKAGEMNVRGGASQLIDGTFAFNVPAWKPKVQSNNSGSQAEIEITQPNVGHLGGDHNYTWDLAVNNQVAIDLTINCGAGQAKLDLGDLDLRRVQVHMGAGQVDVDLRGQPTHDYEVEIQGGVGQANVHLPRDVGVRAEAHGGLGSITVTGLDKKEDYWENDLYNKAKTNVRLKVEGGIGEVRITG